MCSRKKTARSEGCPCQNVTMNCLCGTKRTVRKNEESEHIRNPSAFIRHRRAVEESELEIKVDVSVVEF